MNRLKKTKKIYDETMIPDELDIRVRQTIESIEPTEPRPYRFSSWISLSLSIATAFIFFLNTSDVFAETISDLPIVGQLAKIFTISNYQHEDPAKLVDVKIPALTETGHTELEKQINQEILDKINLTVEKSEKNAEEYYRRFIAAGYDASEFLPVIVHVDYEIKSSNENFVSFVITKEENYVSVDIEKYFYNINLKTGKVTTLVDLFGPNFKDIINPQIEQQIQEREKANNNELFFDEVSKFESIADDQTFYINSNNEVVIVFEKYSIAPGYMGFPEFKISPKVNLSTIQ